MENWLTEHLLACEIFPFEQDYVIKKFRSLSRKKAFHLRKSSPKRHVIGAGKYHLNRRYNSRRTFKSKETDVSHCSRKDTYLAVLFERSSKEQSHGKNKIIDQICLMQMLCTTFTWASKNKITRLRLKVIISCEACSWRHVHCNEGICICVYTCFQKPCDIK